MAARKLEVVFVGDTKLLDAAFARVNGQATGFAGRMEAVGKRTASVGRGLTRNLSAPIALVSGAAGKLALDFDTAMGKVKRLVGASEAQVAVWREQILRMSEELPQAPEELAEALYFVTSSGIETSQVFDVLRTSARTAATGLTDTQTAADLLTSVIGAYGDKAITAARASDVLFAAVKEGKSEPDEMARAMGRAIPLAAQMGVEFEEVAGGMAALSLSGNDAFESATQMSAVMKSFIRPAAKVSKLMAKIDYDQEKMRKTIKEKGLLVALTELRDAAEKNGVRFAELFPNVRALRGALQLTGVSADKNAAIFDAVANSTGQMDKAFEEAQHTAKFKLESAMSTVQVAAIELGAVVVPMVAEALTELASKAKAVGEWFSELDPATQELIVKTARWLALLGPGLVIVGKLTIGIAKFAKAIGFMSGGIVKAIKFAKSWIMPLRGLALVLGGPLMLAIGAVIVGTVLLIKHWDKVKAAVGAVWRWMKNAAEDTFEWITTAVSDSWAWVKRATSDAWGWVKSQLSSVWGWAKNAARDVQRVISSAWNGIKSAVSSAASGARRAVSAAFGAVRDVILAVVDKVLWLFEKFVRGIATIVRAASKVPGIGGKFKGLASDVEGAANKVAGLRGEIRDLKGKTVKVRANVEVHLAPGPNGQMRPGDGWGVESAVTSRTQGLIERDPFKYGVFGGLGGGASGSYRQFIPLANSLGLVLSSGFRPGAITNSGNQSYHALGRAGDFAGSAGAMMRFAMLMAANFGRGLKELIYTPLGFSIKNGQRVPPYAQKDHYDHVHVALAQGGLVRARVGELGPEDVYLPGNARVVQASETARADRTGGPLVNIEHAHFRDGSDADVFARKLAWQLAT